MPLIVEANGNFRAAFADAKVLGIEALEAEAIRRATTENNPSDTLLIFLLKGAMPEKYRENVKVETDLTVHLEASLTQGAKRLEALRGGRNSLSA